jgi:predicted porin
MIKRTIALAVLATLASGAAFAQSSVTLYGRLNVTAERQKFIDTKADYTLENNSSFLGLKGEEDLGGGLKAGFIIESGFNPATGQSNSTFWNRQSEVNLSSAKLGMVRIGSFDAESALATADWVSMHNHDTGSSSDALYSYDSTFKQNKVAYRTPALVKGLTLEVATAERTGTSSARPVDVAANYELGSLKLGAGYSKANGAKAFSARAMYGMGAFTFGGYAARATNAADQSQNIFRVAGMYALGASEFHANVGYAGKLGGVADTQANQATLAYNYNLSKRTKVYGFVTRLDYKATSGVDFNSYAVGVRHLF